MAYEVFEQFAAIGRVHHFWVELHGVNALLVIGDDGKRRAGAGGDRAKTRGKLCHLVAVAHPHLMVFAFAPQPVKQRAAIRNADECTAEFTGITEQHFAAQLVHQRLLAIADAEYRQAAVQDFIGNARAILQYRSRRTRQNDALGLHPLQRGNGGVERGDFRIYPSLAHAARDQLGHLAAEIDNKDGLRR